MRGRLGASEGSQSQGGGGCRICSGPGVGHAEREGRRLVGPSVPPPGTLPVLSPTPLRPQPPLRMLVLPAPGPGPRRFSEAMQAPPPSDRWVPRARTFLLHRMSPDLALFFQAQPLPAHRHPGRPVHRAGGRGVAEESGPGRGVGPEKMLQLPRVLPGSSSTCPALQRHSITHWR